MTAAHGRRSARARQHCGEARLRQGGGGELSATTVAALRTAKAAAEQESATAKQETQRHAHGARRRLAQAGRDQVRRGRPAGQGGRGQRGRRAIKSRAKALEAQVPQFALDGPEATEVLLVHEAQEKATKEKEEEAG